jgi:hypothetical protein
MEIDRKLKRLYARLEMTSPPFSINQITEDDWTTIGMSEADGREKMSQQNFPWKELGDALRRDERDGRLAEELGVSEEYVKDLRRRLYDPDAKPFPPLT